MIPKGANLIARAIKFIDYMDNRIDSPSVVNYSEIARILGSNTSTVRGWCHAYKIARNYTSLRLPDSHARTRKIFILLQDKSLTAREISLAIGDDKWNSLKSLLYKLKREGKISVVKRKERKGKLGGSAECIYTLINPMRKKPNGQKANHNPHAEREIGKLAQGSEVRRV